MHGRNESNPTSSNEASGNPTDAPRPLQTDYFILIVLCLKTDAGLMDLARVSCGEAGGGLRQSVVVAISRLVARVDQDKQLREQRKTSGSRCRAGSAPSSFLRLPGLTGQSTSGLRLYHVRTTKRSFSWTRRQQRRLFEVQEKDLNYSKQSQLPFVVFVLRS